MLMREKRDQTQHRHDVHLKFAGTAGHMLGQRMELEVEDADHEDHAHDENGRKGHQPVRPVRPRNEERQVIRQLRIHPCSNLGHLVPTPINPLDLNSP